MTEPNTTGVTQIVREQQNDVTKPAAGTTTRALWDIADRESTKLNKPAPRKIVVDAYMAEVPGANLATAQTQYARWVRYHGIGAMLAQDKEAEKARLAQEKAEAKEAEKAAKLEAKRLAEEQKAAAKAEAERLAAEKAEQAKALAEQKAAEKAEKARIAAEEKARVKAEKEAAKAAAAAAKEAAKAAAAQQAAS